MDACMDGWTEAGRKMKEREREKREREGGKEKEEYLVRHHIFT